MSHRTHASLVRCPVALLALSFLLICPASGWSQRDLKNIPDPDPEKQRQTFLVGEGLEVNLYASDPQFAKPIQMNFDERGRLWVASSEVYPHIQPGQQATDKIIVLEDRDRDGRAEHSTVFADNLLIPTGVVPGDGGVYVAASTELLHLRDTDGDGRADQRRVVLSGFGTEDTHHLLHTLRWGPDGALYMNQSIYIHSHVETPYGVRRLNGGGIWRFRPDTMELEIVCRGFVNPWGHHFDAWGQSFATDGAYGEGINYVFPGAVFVTAPGATRRLLGLNPGSPKHCGLEILSGRHIPEDWRGTMVTNDFRAHRVCRFVVSEDGSGYASRQATELIKTSHVAFRPIDVKMGPDGAIYVADWYNPIIQHGEVDFRDERRDHVHGRIWRITFKGRPTLDPPNLVEASVRELLDTLTLPEQWNRLHAKLLLKQRGAAAVVPELERWLAELDSDDPATLRHRVEGLWVYECVNRVNESLLAELLASADHRARAAALRVVGRRRQVLKDTDRYLRQGVADSHPRVRLEAVRALAETAEVDAAAVALHALDQPMDRFLDFALWQTMRDLAPQWLPALRRGEPVLGDDPDHLAFALRAVDSPDVIPPLMELLKTNKIPPDRLAGLVGLIASLGGAPEVDALLALIADSGTRLSPDQQAELLDTLIESAERRKLTPRQQLPRVVEFLSGGAPALRLAAVRAAGAWKVAAAEESLIAWAQGKPAGDDRPVPPSLQQAALNALARLGQPRGREVLESMAGGDAPLGIRAVAIGALAELDMGRAANQAIGLLAAMDAGEDPTPVLAPLLQRQAGPTALTQALGGQRLESDVAQLAVRAVQRSSQPDPQLLAALRKAGSLDERRWQFTPALRDELVTLVQRQSDPQRGEQVYRRAELQCLKCHAIGGSGGQVGPDLVSIGASAQVDYLVESLLDPNAKVKENYHSLVIQDENGKVWTGIPIRENERELVLRDPEDRLQTIAVDAIVGRREGQSLMPNGTVDQLTRQELVDLVRFLSELGKVGPYAIDQRRLVRSWQVLLPTPEALHRIRRTSFDTAAGNDPALQWESAYSTVAGHLPVQELPAFIAPTYVTQQRDNRTSFVRFHVEVSTPGAVRLKVSSPEGLTAWLDGKPTPLGETLDLDLATGRHHLTLAVDRLNRTEPLLVELLDVPGSKAQAQLVGGK